jgi:hypothetical protein
MARKTHLERKNTMIKTCVFWTLILGLGYFLVEFISEMDEPPLGMTFHIVVGCLLMAVSGIILFVKLKRYFFPKRKKNRSRPVFLDKELMQQKEKVD